MQRSLIVAIGLPYYNVDEFSCNTCPVLQQKMNYHDKTKMWKYMETIATNGGFVAILHSIATKIARCNNYCCNRTDFHAHANTFNRGRPFLGATTEGLFPVRSNGN
jgi:hypothetical protein